MKYIRKIAEKHTYDYENPPIGKVELWDFSRANENEEARKEAVCLVASISYGNEYCKDPNKLWNLLIERGHESPFEFVRASESKLEILNIRQDDIITEEEVVEILYGKVREEAVKKEIENNKRSFATFKLRVPIFVARQIMRHRSFSFLEISRRYVKGDKVKFLYWLGKDVTMTGYCMLGEMSYEQLIAKGWKPEQARAFLPLGLYTVFWMQGDYRALFNFFIHRLHPETQEETRLVAQAMWELLKEHQPEIIKTMNDYLEDWVKECNPMFRPSRERKAKWFRETFGVRNENF